METTRTMPPAYTPYEPPPPYSARSAELGPSTVHTVHTVAKRTIRYNDGSVYTGDTVSKKINGLTRIYPHGFGILRYSNGSSYVGDWKNGRWHGRGAFTASGIRGAGTFKNGLLHDGTEVLRAFPCFPLFTYVDGNREMTRFGRIMKRPLGLES